MRAIVNKLAVAATALGLAAISSAAVADAQDKAWVLSGEDSKIAYGSIKKDTVGELNHFTGLSGSVSETGEVAISIELSTVETWIDIRNERMVEHVFSAIGVSSAELAAQIDMAEVAALTPGETTTIDAEGVLQFGSAALEIEASFFVARLSDSRALIVTDEMIMVSTADLGIDEGVDKLMELASLPGITRVAPITMRLVFDRVAESKAAAPAADAVQVAAAGDVKKGKRVFKRCAACHVVDAETNKVGPHLVGLFGREAAAVSGFNYSDAFAASDVVWTAETLGAFLTAPKNFIPGNKMAFNGLKKEADIENILAYMASATAP